MLAKYLTESRIKLKVKATDWRDVVTKVGKLMLKEGDISSSYIDAMQKAIEDLGPYSVVAPGIVLLHARPEDGVNNISLVMITLHKGINFCSKNDPVYLAIGLGAVDHKSHIDLLQDLSFLLQDERIVKKLLAFNAEDVSEALAMIKNYHPSGNE